MKPSKPAPFDPARLPEGLRSRGRPLQVHRPWGKVIDEAARGFVARVFGETWRDIGSGSGAALQRAALFVLGGLLLVGGFVALGVYFIRPPANEDPRIVLIAAGVMFVLGAGSLALAFFYRPVKDFEKRLATRPGSLLADMPELYLVYKDGLATVTGNTFEFMEWAAVKELAWVRLRMNRHLALTDQDGHEMVVWQHGYTETGELRLAVQERVNEVLLPKVLKKIAAGKSAKFGLFAISQDGLWYRGRQAEWEDIKSLKLHTHRGLTRLTIYVRGRLIPWAWCNVDDVPNWRTFYGALCRIAPGRLLTKSTQLHDPDAS